MKLSMDLKDQNTQPLMNSARANESETALGSTKPTNFSSYDSSLNKERDDFFIRHNKTTDMDSPINLSEDNSIKKN